MSSHAASGPPTAKQLGLLKTLCARNDWPYDKPSSRRDASTAIAYLLRLERGAPLKDAAALELRAARARSERSARRKATIEAVPAKRSPSDEPTRSQLHDLAVHAVRAGDQLPATLTRAEASALLAQYCRQAGAARRP